MRNNIDNDLITEFVKILTEFKDVQDLNELKDLDSRREIDICNAQGISNWYVHYPLTLIKPMKNHTLISLLKDAQTSFKKSLFIINEQANAVMCRFREPNPLSNPNEVYIKKFIGTRDHLLTINKNLFVNNKINNKYFDILNIEASKMLNIEKNIEKNKNNKLKFFYSRENIQNKEYVAINILLKDFTLNKNIILHNDMRTFLNKQYVDTFNKVEEEVNNNPSLLDGEKFENKLQMSHLLIQKFG